MSEGYYDIDVFCTNCDYKGPVSIEKGKFVEDAECPQCSTVSLGKVQKPARLVPRRIDYR